MPVSENASGAAAHAIQAGRRTYIVVLLTTIYALSFLDRQIINILAEPIKVDLHLADWQMGAMSGFAFALLYTVLGLPVARMAERGNRSWIIAGALTLWSGFTALTGMAGSFVHLLLVRTGVGIGEAGLIPPAHSLISDITPREKRSSALAVFSMGVPFGTLLGMGLGGIVGQLYGWRIAFLLVGLPGIALALLLLITVQDPRMGRIVGMTRPRADVPPLLETLRLLRTTPSFRWLSLGGAMIAFEGYGHQTFFGSFYLRNFGPDLDGIAHSFGVSGRLALIGMALGLILGLSAVFGTSLGGHLGDGHARVSPKGYLTVPIWATAACVPFFVVAFLVRNATLSLLLLVIPSFLKAMWYGPIYACLQGIVPPRARATTVAIFLFISNTIGIGLGPLLGGSMSDLLARSLGPAEGLRIAMIALSFFLLLAVACFHRARRTIEQDLRS